MNPMMLRPIVCFFVGAIAFGAADASPVALAGRLPPVVTNRGTPYLVTGDITVPPGVTVTIDSGVVFLFRNFTGLIVQGTVLALGTPASPVVFTSEHDRPDRAAGTTAAAPYDWNGITVEQGTAGSMFRNCHIRYSLFGVNSLSGHIRLEQCVFEQNGKSDLVVAGKKVSTLRGPFSYGAITRVAPVPLAVKADRPRQGGPRGYLRVAGLSLLVGGAVASAWETDRYRDAQERLDLMNDTSRVDNLQNPSIALEWDRARRDRDSHRTAMIVSYAVAFIGAAGIAVSIAF